MTAAVLRLKVTLDDVEPKVLRRIEVLADIKLDRLHLTLQAALGWTNGHLFEIRARDTGWGIPSPDWPDGPLDARKAKLIDVIEDAGTKTLRYIYDYGDCWEHTIKVERMIAADPSVAYPRLVEATGRCPPEDVGGPWGYGEMLEAIADPEHERHDEICEWLGEEYDPNAFDAAAREAEVASLAKRWSRRPRTKTPSAL
jgi:Plasmid pRiA4b ORF-3-like protein